MFLSVIAFVPRLKRSPPPVSRVTPRYPDLFGRTKRLARAASGQQLLLATSVSWMSVLRRQSLGVPGGDDDSHLESFLAPHTVQFQ